jgi:hypothetical protein
MRRRLFHIQLLCLLPLLAMTGCGDHPAAPPAGTPEAGSWTIYTPFDWAHDGEPSVYEYCTIYSDAADDEMKAYLGECADERFEQIIELFGLREMSDLIYPPGYSTIEIYINRDHAENINWAHWGGFIITIRASEITGHWCDYVAYTVRHELTHNLEFLIEGREDLRTDVWFREGLAVSVGCIEHTGWQTIQSLGELESWIEENRDVQGSGNPIAIHTHADFPPDADRHRYYQYFELAVRYLLDDRGMGRSYEDALNVFYDIRHDISFSAAFDDRFGISVGDFETEFYDRMRTYLGE